MVGGQYDFPTRIQQGRTVKPFNFLLTSSRYWLDRTLMKCTHSSANERSTTKFALESLASPPNGSHLIEHREINSCVSVSYAYYTAFNWLASHVIHDPVCKGFDRVKPQNHCWERTWPTIRGRWISTSCSFVVSFIWKLPWKACIDLERRSDLKGNNGDHITGGVNFTFSAKYTGKNPIWVF